MQSEKIQKLRNMLESSQGLAVCFAKYSAQTSSSQLRTEFGKLAAAARNHSADIERVLEDENGSE